MKTPDNFPSPALVRQAAKSLQEEIGDQAWLTSIGIGKQEENLCLLVYVSIPIKRVSKKVPAEWQGIPVVVRRMAPPKSR